ncbi:MAG TPA: ChbG/HpnK family deacetylase, partial [Blastocatellia bacterium]|nr:ChbG/HpnK family deacetylase [Blastocatellia bacterium]
MKFLIVNADDFGLTGGVNRAVIEAHTRGILTSTTVMANMPAFEDAVQLAKSNPSLGVGLHFNITQGAPVAEASRVGSLLDERGEFLGTSTALLVRALTGKLRVAEIEIELRAQIEKVLQSGLKLTHVDSHKHAHALPPVADVLARVIGDYGIRAVRLPREQWWFDAAAAKQSLGAFGLAQLCRVSAGQLRRAGVKTADAFFGVTQTGFWTKAWLLELIARLPEGVSELMTHPGYDDAELHQTKTRLRASRAMELSLLTDADIIAAVREYNVRLSSYA